MKVAFPNWEARHQYKQCDSLIIKTHYPITQQRTKWTDVQLVSVHSSTLLYNVDVHMKKNFNLLLNNLILTISFLIKFRMMELIKDESVYR